MILSSSQNYRGGWRNIQDWVSSNSTQNFATEPPRSGTLSLVFSISVNSASFCYCFYWTSNTSNLVLLLLTPMPFLHQVLNCPVPESSANTAMMNTEAPCRAIYSHCSPPNLILHEGIWLACLHPSPKADWGAEFWFPPEREKDAHNMGISPKIKAIQKMMMSIVLNLKSFSKWLASQEEKQNWIVLSSVWEVRIQRLWEWQLFHTWRIKE